jgi:hypothetical protein
MRVHIILGILTIALLGCEKDVITVEEPKEITAWMINKDFTDLAKVNITSISTSKSLFTYGPDFFSTIDNQGEVSHAFNRLKHPSSARLPISGTYYIEIDDKWVRFANSEWPVDNDRSGWVDLTKLAIDFAYVNTGTGLLNRHGTIAINDDAQCLIPIVTTDTEKDIVAYLFSTEVEDISYVKVTDTIRLNIPNPSTVKSQIVYLTKGIKDYFIISVDGGTFKVTGDGQTKNVINTSLDNLFVSQGKLYGLKEPNSVYTSANDGETWESFNGFPAGFVLAHYSVIEDSIIGVKNSEIFTLTHSNGQFKIRDLMNLGLENVQINSIVKFQDSIYASTTSGVFVKPRDKFFETRSTN